MIRRHLYLIFIFAARLFATNFQSPFYTTDYTDVTNGYVVKNKYSGISELSCAMKCNHDEYCVLFGVRLNTQEHTNKECIIFKKMGDSANEKGIDEQYKDLKFYKQQYTELTNIKVVNDDSHKTETLTSISEYLSHSKQASYEKSDIPRLIRSSFAEMSTLPCMLSEVSAKVSATLRVISIDSPSESSNLPTVSAKPTFNEDVGVDTTFVKPIPENDIGSSTILLNTQNYETHTAKPKLSNIESSIAVRSSLDTLSEYRTVRSCPNVFPGSITMRSNSERLATISCPDALSEHATKISILDALPITSSTNRNDKLFIGDSASVTSDDIMRKRFTVTTQSAIRHNLKLSTSFLSSVSSDTTLFPSTSYAKKKESSSSMGLKTLSEFMPMESNLNNTESTHPDSPNYTARTLEASSSEFIEMSESKKNVGQLDSEKHKSNYKVSSTMPLSSMNTESENHFDNSNILSTDILVSSVDGIIDEPSTSVVTTSVFKYINSNADSKEDSEEEEEKDDDDLSEKEIDR